MRDLVTVRTGIALSGGGAKGAYQIGMFRALEEAGLAKKNLVLSGCSIGAMTALVYAVGDANLLRHFLHRLGAAFDSPFRSGSAATAGRREGRNTFSSTEESRMRCGFS